MHVLALAVLAVAAIFAAACDDDEAAVEPDATPAPTREAATPIPTEEPPEEVPDVVPEGYNKTPVFPGVNFNRMVGLYQEPGAGRHIVVLLQDGLVYRADLGAGDPQPTLFLDISGSLKFPLATEEGLLGMAFAPDYETSGELYVMYTADGPRRNVLSRFTAAGGAVDASSERVVLEVEQPAGNHNGGALAFGPDGYLYVALGDGGGGGDQFGNGQNTNTLLGSILRVDVAGEPYGIPDDNPFAGGGGAPEIFAYGLRNPWRMSFDAETGELWAADVGQNRWEEVNRIERGGNYGWPIMEGPECFLAATCPMDGLELPLAWYPTAEGCAIIGGYVYRGDALPELDGWYLYADYCSGRVWGLNASQDGAEPVVLVPPGEPISSFGLVDGELFVVGYTGSLFALERR